MLAVDFVKTFGDSNIKVIDKDNKEYLPNIKFKSMSEEIRYVFNKILDEERQKRLIKMLYTD